MPDRPEVIVIGGGAIGCSASYYLARQGYRVRMLEARQVGRGCSYGNCGYICPSHALPLTTPGAIARVVWGMFDRNSAFYVGPSLDRALWCWLARFAGRCRMRPMLEAAAARHALLASSFKLMRDLMAEEKIDAEWQGRGLLIVYENERAFSAHESAATLVQREFGIESSAYAGSRLTALEPALRDGFAGGWHYPGDAHLRPDRLMPLMQSVLQERRVEVLEETVVRRIETTGNRAVKLDTSRGPMECETIVLAAGAESPRLARQLGCYLPIQPGKGYSITLPRPPRAPTIPIIFEESHVAVTPWQSGIRIGSTMEFVGYNRQRNPRRVKLFEAVAARSFVEPVAGPIELEWNGWRPMVYDEVPCIGPAPRAANVFIAAGHGMIGMSTMAATGKLVGELVLGSTPHIDPTPYSPSRFGR